MDSDKLTQGMLATAGGTKRTRHSSHTHTPRGIRSLFIREQNVEKCLEDRVTGESAPTETEKEQLEGKGVSQEWAATEPKQATENGCSTMSDSSRQTGGPQT